MEQVSTPIYPAGPAVYSYFTQSPTIPVGGWLITYLISLIPFVGFITLFVWAFSSGTPPSRANWAKATLAVTASFMALSALFFVLFASTLVDMLTKTVTNTRPR